MVVPGKRLPPWQVGKYSKGGEEVWPPYVQYVGPSAYGNALVLTNQTTLCSQGYQEGLDPGDRRRTTPIKKPNLNEVGVKPTAHSTLQAAGASQCAVWEPYGERAHTQPFISLSCQSLKKT